MDNITNIDLKNSDHFHQEFIKSTPVHSILLKDFLKKEIALSLFDECQNTDDTYWKVFTRNGSHMKEYNIIDDLPNAYRFYSFLHSSPFLKWLEGLTGIEGLIPDPHLIGAGYSKSFNGDILKIHTDFNWNEKLKLHRVLSLIVYLTPEWEEEWGGGLDFYDSERKNVIKTFPCLFNNCLIWKFDELGFHGYNKPIDCPEDKSRNSIRAFYYISNSKHSDIPPHRSLYWFDEETKKPFDKKEEI